MQAGDIYRYQQGINNMHPMVEKLPSVLSEARYFAIQAKWSAAMRRAARQLELEMMRDYAWRLQSLRARFAVGNG